MAPMFCTKLFNWGKNKKDVSGGRTTTEHVISQSYQEGEACPYWTHMQCVPQNQIQNHSQSRNSSSRPHTPTALNGVRAVHQREPTTATVRSPSAIRRVQPTLTHVTSPYHSPVHSPAHSPLHTPMGRQSPVCYPVNQNGSNQMYQLQHSNSYHSPMSGSLHKGHIISNNSSGSLHRNTSLHKNGHLHNSIQHSNSHHSPLHNASTHYNQHGNGGRHSPLPQLSNGGRHSPLHAHMNGMGGGQGQHKGFIVQETYSQPYPRLINNEPIPPPPPNHPPPPLPSQQPPPLPPGHPGEFLK